MLTHRWDEWSGMIVQRRAFSFKMCLNTHTHNPNWKHLKKMNNMFRRNITFGLYSVSPYIGYSTIRFWLPFCFFFCCCCLTYLISKIYKSSPGKESLTSFSCSVSSVILDDAVASVSLQSRVGTKWRQNYDLAALQKITVALFTGFMCCRRWSVPVWYCVFHARTSLTTPMATNFAIFSKCRV